MKSEHWISILIGVAIIAAGQSLIRRFTSGGERATDEPAINNTPTAATVDATTPVASAPIPLPGKLYRGSDHECLVTEHGLRAKVWTHTDTIAQYEGAPDRRIGFWTPLYVFDVFPREPAAEPTHFYVGTSPRRSSELGWVPAAACFNWPTLYGVKLAPGAASEIFAEPQALVDPAAYANVQPLARAVADGRPHRSPWPVVANQRVVSDARAIELVQLNFMAGLHRAGIHRKHSPTISREAYSEEELTRIKANVRTLQLVIVLDNTISTTPYLPQMKQALLSLIERLKQGPLRLQVACVGYRDHVPAIMWPGEKVTKAIPLTSDLPTFLAQLVAIEPATDSSIDWPEAGLDGQLAAFTDVNWPDEKLRDAVVVHVSDNSWHELGHPRNPHGITADKVIEHARSRRARIFGLCVLGQGGEDEQRLHWQQMKALCSQTGGDCFFIEDVNRLAASVASVLRQPAENDLPSSGRFWY